MNRLAIILGIVTVTVVCWGTYGPVLHLGQVAMEGSRLRPFIGVGVAYFMVAVILPLILAPRIHEPGRWTAIGILWSIFAGLLGALGSLGVIFAFHAGGTPVFVMPLVFGGAPVVNTLVTLATSRSATKPAVGFFIGIALVALGAAGVLKFKPQPAAATPSAETAPANTSTDPAPNAAVPDEAGTGTEQANAVGERQTWWGFFGTIGAIGLTAVCWGSYGPTLHRGQAAMLGSRLRPFLCVGISYFVVAIVIPAAMLMKSPEPGEWNLGGLLWSLAAGGLGAFGALGVIMAFTCGGKPSYVMPIVFGGAPVVNTATTMFESWCRHGSYGEITPLFLAALGTVIVGAVTVLLFAPKTPTGSTPSHPPVASVDEAENGPGEDGPGEDGPAEDGPAEDDGGANSEASASLDEE